MEGAHRPGILIFCNSIVKSFNPCFDGRGSPTFSPRRDLHAAECFNPCFDGRGSPTHRTFAHADVRFCFNPCFDGRGSPTAGGLQNKRSLCLVSILVLMEGAHRQVIGDDRAQSGLSFNPCFDGRGSPTQAMQLPPAREPVFQSLF